MFLDDWTDSDGTSGTTPETDSEDSAGADASRQPRPAGSEPADAWESSWDGEGADAGWAAFPGPLPPVGPATRAKVAASVVDPMGLGDAEWEAWLPPLVENS